MKPYSDPVSVAAPSLQCHPGASRVRERLLLPDIIAPLGKPFATEGRLPSSNHQVAILVTVVRKTLPATGNSLL